MRNHWRRSRESAGIGSDAELHAAHAALAHSHIRSDLIADIAAAMVETQPADIDDSVDQVLARVADYTGADDVFVFRASADMALMCRTHAWSNHDTSFTRDVADWQSTEPFPVWRDLLRNLSPLSIGAPTPDDPEADSPTSAWAVLAAFGVQSLLAVPLVRNGHAVGTLGIQTVQVPRSWSADDIALLDVVANLIASTLARRDAELEAAVSDSRLRSVAMSSSDAIIIIDATGVVSHQPMGEELFGYTPEDLFATNALDLVHPEDIAFAGDELMKAALDPGYHATNPMRIRHADGRWIPIELKAFSRFDDPAIQGIIMNVRDVSDRKRTEAELSASEKRLDALIANVPGAVFRCEPIPPYRDIFISDAIEDLTGYPPDVFLRHELELYDLVVAEHQIRLDQMIQDSLICGGSYSVEYQFQHRDGTLRWVEERGQMIFDPSGAAVWIDGAMLDLGDRKALEHRLAHEASHDPLTGLPNRTLLLEHLDRAVARAHRRQTTTAVLFVDLDRFKLVNDALGHTAGDELLIQLSRRLCSVMRSSDLATRTGGDEFVIVCSDLDDPNEAEIIAGRIASVLRDPFTVHGRTVFVTASIGIAFVEPGTSAGDVLRSADAAAYRAKDRGRNRYEVFDEALRAATAAALETETDLHHALSDHQLFLRYQPVVALQTGEITGAEGLVRWQHPERGLLPPDQFLPAAEASGLIVAIGREVLALAVGAMGSITELALPMVAINLAPRELAQPDLVERVRRTLNEHDVAAHRLCIEITESAVLDEVETAIATLVALRSLGVKLAIDDFGTGYSSLSYLRRLPVDVVKIDRSFTSEIGDDASNLTIIAGIIGLARGLGLDVVAEGVETVRQRDTLRELGCTFGQGYLFSPPIALDDLLGLSNQRTFGDLDARH